MLEPAPFPVIPEVFIDGFSPGMDFQAFGNSKVDALGISTDIKYRGTRALRVTVPSVGDPSGWFAGGVFATSAPRDFSSFDALTFWARASAPANLDLVGFADDNSGNSPYRASRSNLQLTTSWQRFVLPIPDASRLMEERGLFFFSDGADADAGYDVWFDDVQFEDLGTIANPSFDLGASINLDGGQSHTLGELTVTFDVNGIPTPITASPAYFTFSSANTGVATVSSDGVITAGTPGTTDITISLGSATGTVSVVVTEPPPGPDTAAPAPTQDAADVISLFSNAYTDVPVDTWSADWDVADVSDIQIAGDDVKFYRNLLFAGITFESSQINASDMTHFHMDIWTPDPTDPPATFAIELNDFGPDGAFNTGDEATHRLVIQGAPLESNNWVSLDIPLQDFTGLTQRANLAQFVIITDPGPETVYVDNVYFYRGDVSGGGGTSAPDMAAPAPTQDASTVTSLFSNAYTDVTVDTWSADWDNANFEDTAVAGDDVKLYTNLDFAGIEFTSSPVDASAHTHFRMDVWTPDDTNPPAAFRIKLVDFGPNGVFDGGDDTEHEITLDATTSPSLVSGQWNQLDFDLANWTGLASRAALAQLIISGTPNTVYVDNVYFYTSDGTGGGGGGGTTAPASPAPTPTQDAGEVTSMFSNAYSDVTVDTWSTDWDNTDFEDTAIAGDDVKLYTNMSLVGIEATSSPIDASSHTHFRMDIWTPDDTNPPAAFRIKLVDFGADGVFGGDDTEHEVTLDATTSPALIAGQWNQLDFDLANWTGLASRAAIAQLILSGDPNTVYVDNIYFYGNNGGGGGNAMAPAAPAPMPTQDASEVTSMFSNAYSDVTVDTWSTDWDNTDFEDTAIAGDDVKLYTNMSLVGIEATSSPIDASSHTHFRMDIWTPDDTNPPAVFRIKLVDFGADGVFGGDDTEHEVTLDATTSPALIAGQWNQLDFDLANWTGLASRAAIAQLILSGDPNTIYVDNIYFYGNNGGGGNGGGTSAPAMPAPMPMQDASEVTSLFSNAYTDVTVDTWSAVWDNADLEDTAIAGDDVKLYTNLGFAGVEATSAPVDASSHTHFRMDVWTPDDTNPPAAFRIKLVDFGADGMFDGGDDSEHEITLDATTSPALIAGQWNQLDFDLANWTGLTSRAAIAQLIISGDPNTVYVDNVFFYGSNGGGGGNATEPPSAAPTPTYDAGDTISLFSDAYTDVAVDTWSAVWDNADLEDIAVAGDNVKLYTNLAFAGIEATSSPIDASSMTHFRIDMWTPDDVTTAAFRVKLVDFGADGAFDGGDDVEHELTFTAASSPALTQGTWVTLDIPLSEFVNLTTRSAMAQFIISGDLPTVYIDNVLFHR